MDAIKPFSFLTSPYPVILSIENHCSPQQQDRMAEHMINILGDMLYTQPVDKTEDKLPSPEQLKNKILLKAKKIKTEETESMPAPPPRQKIPNFRAPERPTAHCCGRGQAEQHCTLCEYIANCIYYDIIGAWD
jgi:hypothetical protein